jgi:uncharacterized protein
LRSTAFVDSGAWIALNLPADALHERATRALTDLGSARLVTSSDVVDESITRCRYEGGMRSAERLRRSIRAAVEMGRIEFVWAEANIYDEAWTLLEQFADIKLSFTDATSAVIAKRAKADYIFGFDSDFRALGFQLIPG